MEHLFRSLQSPYGKKAVKWLAITLALYALAGIVREVAWTSMIAGTGYVVAFTLLVIFGVLGTIAFCTAIFFAMLAV